jgi:hypothetical protein
VKQTDLLGQKPEFQQKPIHRKKAIMPLFEDKSTREYIQGVALQVARGEQSP